MIKIVHHVSQWVLAEGSLGWGITQIEGNYYCRLQFNHKPNNREAFFRVDVLVS